MEDGAMWGFMAVLVLLFAGSCGPGAEPGGSPPVTASSERPAWLDEEPIIIVGGWDDMPLFRRRMGSLRTWHDEAYEQAHTEERVLQLKELGVTMAVLHFYKGFGLEAEAEHLAYARKLAELCRKHGIRVGVYVGSTVAYETFLLEKPEAEAWFVPDYLGQPVHYGRTQTFRKRVYFSHPGYKEYIRKVVRMAVEDFQADLIHFDNTSTQARRPMFFHPLAIRDFRDFLERKYTPEVLKRRLGFNDLRYVTPPAHEDPLSTITDPLFQEWADFRCHQLTQYYREMKEYIHSLNPQVAVENNPHIGMSGVNTVWEQGVDYPRLLEHTDIVWTEEGNDAGISPEGVLVSKIRSYKTATGLGNKIFSYTFRTPLMVAEAMAYNRGCLGMVGGIQEYPDPPPTHRRYIRFYRDRFDYYRKPESAADVAVLHSYATMAFNNDRPYQSTYLFEQALIQAKVPFDIIFDRHLSDLSRYRVLVLADQECLSGEQMDQVRDFVKRGGGLVATEHTSLFTTWRSRRSDFGLADLFAVQAPEFVPWPPRPEAILAIDPVRRREGEGRVVYLPEVQPAVEKPATEPMTSRYWHLPVNWRELVLSPSDGRAGDDPLLEVKGPLTVTAELLSQERENRLLLHLINYGMDENPLVRDLQITLRAGPETVRKVYILSPDGEEIADLEFVADGNRIQFTLPRLETYTLVVRSERGRPERRLPINSDLRVSGAGVFLSLGRDCHGPWLAKEGA